MLSFFSYGYEILFFLSPNYYTRCALMQKVLLLALSINPKRLSRRKVGETPWQTSGNSIKESACVGAADIARRCFCLRKLPLRRILEMHNHFFYIGEIHISAHPNDVCRI